MHHLPISLLAADRHFQNTAPFAKEAELCLVLVPLFAGVEPSLDTVQEHGLYISDINVCYQAMSLQKHLKVKHFFLESLPDS